MEKDTRPWGEYEVIVEGEGYKAKRITVKPNSILSLQKHFQRSEHWTVVSGVGHVTKDEDVVEVKANESIYLPVECIHRMENKHDTDNLVFIEVQCGDYLGEDDIERIEDSYGRA